MIVVVGSRHDSVAVELSRRWPGGALCDADDLMAPGWRWSAGGERTWVVGGALVPDADVTGVFVRRSAVYPEELAGTHPDDRGYLAAEALATLVFALATTSATVVNPIDAGTLGLDALRPERWMRVAADLGIGVAPLRLASGTSPASVTQTPALASTVEVVAGSPCGHAWRRAETDAAVALAGALGLRWAVVGFDEGGRLCALSTTTAPSPEAAERLGAVLSTRTGPTA